MIFGEVIFLAKIEKSIEIKASPEKVWKMLALDRLIEWNKGFKEDLKSVEYTSEVHTSEDKLRVGASAHGISKKDGESIKFNFEITESLEKEKMAYRFSFGKLAKVFVTYLLESVGEGTKLTYLINYEMSWGILGKMLGKVATMGGEKDVERDLERFKSILEK
jgi:carbon monoxide dehydrogenase subunit G